MTQIVCAADAANTTQAALFAQILSANDVHCIVQRIDPEVVPDFGSNGIRQVMVNQEDLGKAQRLLAEIEVSHSALEEYQVKSNRRLHAMHWIVERIHQITGR